MPVHELALMADSSVIQCSQACTVTVQHEIVTPILSLSADEGAAIAGAILAVWVVGFAFRLLVRSLRDTDGNSSSTGET